MALGCVCIGEINMNENMQKLFSNFSCPFTTSKHCFYDPKNVSKSTVIGRYQICASDCASTVRRYQMRDDENI